MLLSLSSRNNFGAKLKIKARKYDRVENSFREINFFFFALVGAVDWRTRPTGKKGGGRRLLGSTAAGTHDGNVLCSM